MTISEIKRLHEQAGFHFFSPGAMRFFNSKIETEVIGDNYFITSEYMNDPKDKAYTIRQFNTETNEIDDISAFGEYKTLKEAKEALKDY